MTEDEWHKSDDALAMLEWLGGRPGERKLRLFACHCLRDLGDALPFESQECVKYMEKHCDGLLKWLDVGQRITRRSHVFARTLPEAVPICLLNYDAGAAARNTCYWASVIKCGGVDLSYDPMRLAYNEPDEALESFDPCYRSTTASTLHLIDALRDIVGHPHHSQTFRRGWRSSSALALARTMYDARDFAALPILADALEESGCDDARILDHCREPNLAHVRGCWVVDLVLGKS